MFDRRLKTFGLVAVLALTAGCAQEGRLLDTPVKVNAFAYDQFRDTTSVTGDSVYFSTRLKVNVHAANPCEATHLLLELRRTGDNSAPTFIVRPIARYNLDDPCTALGTTPKDTTLTLTVTGLRTDHAFKVPFEIDQASGPSFTALLDSAFISPTAGSIRFEFKVQDKTTAAPIVGATVALDSLSASGPQPIGSTTTDGTGLATFDVASTVGRGVAAIKYRVTVTNGSDTIVVDVRVAPALGKSRERMTVRI